MSIAKKIRDTRISAGLTQRELAEAAKMGLRSLQYVEGDAHDPDTRTIQKLAAALGVPMSVLLDENLSGEAYRIGAMAERLRPEDRQAVVGLIQRLEIA